MTENDYLNPSDIKKQCDTAICKLERDSAALQTVESTLDTFINDDEIKSVAYDALKQQISDYKTLLRAMREANSSDETDFTVLKAAVGDEILDGANILAQKRAALSAKESDMRMAEECEREARLTEYSWIAWYYSWKANQYWQMAEIDQEIYNQWQAKEDSFNAIEETTRGLFYGSVVLRQAAQNGLESITGIFQNGTYVLDMGATWRTDIVTCYAKRMYTENENGEIVIHWAEVEKVLQKDASDILDEEYEALAYVYLKADDEGMVKFLEYCMERKADVNIPWYAEALGPSAGLVNQDYSEWVVNEKKVGRIQREIEKKSEELLMGMREFNDGEHQEQYKFLKEERNLTIQRLTLITIVKEQGIFRGEYQGKYPSLSIETDNKLNLKMTFCEFGNVGSNYCPTMSNLAKSAVTIDYTTNGDSIMMDLPQDVELEFKAYFCNASVAKDTAEFAYDEALGEMISNGSEKVASYAAETLGKEALGDVIKTVPIAGDVAGFVLDEVVEQAEQKEAFEFIEGKFDEVSKAYIYSNFGCSVNYVHYNTAENSAQILYSYGGEKTDERVERADALFQEKLGQGLTKEEVLTNPNKVYNLYEALIEKDVHNKDLYDNAVNDDN